MDDNSSLLDSLVWWLKAIHGPLDEWLTRLPPWSWTASAIGLFVLGAIAALLFDRDFVYKGAPDKALWRDLRIWAVLFLIPFVGVYLLAFILSPR